LPDPEVVELPESRSRIDRIYGSEQFQRRWDNNVAFHVAASILQLRKFRGWSQARLARAAGTSQSAIARIEGEDGNITISTLERLIAALKGRLRLFIPPEELAAPKPPNWWEIPRTRQGGWTVTGVFIQDDGDSGKKAAVLLAQSPEEGLTASAEREQMHGAALPVFQLTNAQESAT
jgi:transcriptional regulator with XRE-family HTH domain